MNKKIICILFCAVLVTTLLPLTSASNVKTDAELKQNCVLDGYILDQSQIIGAGSSEIAIDDFQCAQSFKPTITLLVKVEIKGYCRETTAPLIISTRVTSRPGQSGAINAVLISG